MWGRGVLPAALPAPFSTTLSPALSVYLRECGVAGSASARTACPFVPHSASLGSATATRVLSTPPTGLDECFFFISLVLDFLAVRFPVSSGCARRRSVSTYAAILVPPVRGFEASFHHAGTLGCAVCLPPQLFLLAYPHANMGPPSPPAAVLPTRLMALLYILFTLAALLCLSYQFG